VKATSFQKGLSLLVLLALLLSATSCSAKAELLALALQFLPEYLTYKTTGTSGIPEVDALLTAKSQLDKIDQADKLVAEGRKKGDITKVEQAMAMRPGDWRYGYQAGALLLEQGDAAGAKKYFDNASYGGQNMVTVDNPVIEGESRVYPKDQYAVKVLEESRQKMQDQGWKNRDQCVYSYDQLIWHYRNVTGVPVGGEKPKVDAIIAQLESEKARLCPK
jgi:hypothetical protein